MVRTRLAAACAFGDPPHPKVWSDLRELRRLQEAPIAQARGATVDLELGRVKLEHVLDIEELRLVRAHFASFRRVSS